MLVPPKTASLVDNILIDGVCCGEAENERAECDHGDAEDHQPMPAVKETTKVKENSGQGDNFT